MSLNTFKFESLKGAEAKKFIQPLAELRIEVFREFPYLYDGTFEYEKKYLERYFASKNACVVILKNEEEIIGASTAIYLPDEDPMISQALARFYDPHSFVYFGESIIKKAYRGQGFGKKFFELREEFARSIQGVKWTGFCAVIRDSQDTRRPKEYFSPEALWLKQSYKKVEGLFAEIAWKELDEEKESPKKLQFWTKELSR